MNYNIKNLFYLKNKIYKNFKLIKQYYKYLINNINILNKL